MRPDAGRSSLQRAAVARRATGPSENSAATRSFLLAVRRIAAPQGFWQPRPQRPGDRGSDRGEVKAVAEARCVFARPCRPQFASVPRRRAQFRQAPRGTANGAERPRFSRPREDRPQGDRPQGDRPSASVRNSNRPGRAARTDRAVTGRRAPSRFDRPREIRPKFDRPPRRRQLWQNIAQRVTGRAAAPRQRGRQQGFCKTSGVRRPRRISRAQARIRKARRPSAARKEIR